MNKDIINKNPMFSGYASVFNVVDQHNDIVAPGAFKKTLANNKPENIKLLWQHNHDYPIGKIIKITEDKKGLKIEAELILAVKKASEAFALISNKAICGLSIGFNVVKAVKNRKTKTRIITEIDLLEISLVTFPANKESQVMTIKSI